MAHQKKRVNEDDIIDVEIVEHTENEKIHRYRPVIKDKFRLIPGTTKDNLLVWGGIILAIITGISLVIQFILLNFS